jgi:hypothetical protein
MISARYWTRFAPLRVALHSPAAPEKASLPALRHESNFSVAVMTIRSDELNFKNAIASGLKADSEVTGRTIAQNLACGVQPDTLGLIMLGDGLSMNFDRFAAGLESELQLGSHLPLFGGTSADNWS